MAVILLLDDEKSIRTILGALLKDAGHEVIEAADTDEAIRCVERYPLDVALLDILLGTGNGLDVARHIHDWRPDVRVILMTGEPNFASARQSISLRIFDYLVKPFEPQAVLETISRAAAAKARDMERILLIKERERTQEDLERRVRVRTAELNQAAVNLHALAAHLQVVREEERKALARELHDEFGQKLTALQIDLSWLDRKLQPVQPGLGAEMRDKIVAMMPLVEQLTEMTQAICASLRPGMLDDLGLLAAIEWQVEDCERRTGLKCALSIPAEDLVLERDDALALFRILQEALTNVVRHAQATQVMIKLVITDGELEMDVQDNGRGFTPEACPVSEALGLLSMRERAIGFQGTVNIQSKPGHGTAVQVRMPLVQRVVTSVHGENSPGFEGPTTASGTSSSPSGPVSITGSDSSPLGGE
jgi:signal transduction histidine kinase